MVLTFLPMLPFGSMMFRPCKCSLFGIDSKTSPTTQFHEPAQRWLPGFPKSQVLWGGISGALAAWLTTPFDVIKTRVMTATQALTFGDALRSVATTGATGLFAGAGARSAWWFCVSSVFFGTYERLRSSFQQKLED